MKKTKFAIIGNPISHSLSPTMHNYWFKKYKINAEYELLEVDKEIDSINQIEELLAEIRSRRIKRVKEAAKEKKIKKQEEKIKRSKEIKERKINSPTFLGRGVSNRLTFITDKK